MSGASEPSARIVISREFTIGTIDRRLFGSFVEHMGRCVYTGIFEPGHPLADPDGFRTDVEALVDELGPTLVRYPGGNFVSGYQWEDGIGPKELRPRRVDYAWRSVETNQVGVDEFLPWTERRGLETMMAVNLGTRGIIDAANLVEYCNVEGATYWSDLRRSNGRNQPYGISLWCLGNEMDGPWQTGHKTAIEYGRLAAQTAQAMKAVDPSIELVACGSSSRDMPTFGDWESTVLGECYDYVDYISLHAYYQERDGDRRSFLESGAQLDGFIRDVAATVDSVAAKRHSTKRVNLSLDEWNVWYISNQDDRDLGIREAPRLIEDDYSALDAIVVDRHDEQRRPREDRRASPTRQRDRAHPHRAGRRCVAHDHVLSFRVGRDAGGRDGAGCTNRVHLADASRTSQRRRRRIRVHLERRG